MPRAYRTKITVSLALASAQVNVYTAIEKEAGNTIVCTGKDEQHTHVATQIKQTRVCPVPDCENSDPATFRSVAPTGDGGGVLLDAGEREAIKKAAAEATKDRIALTPHPVENVRSSTIPSGSVYWLSAQPSIGWDHLVDAMARHPEVAFLGTWSPQGKPNLYEFRMFGTTMLMVQVARTEAIKVEAQPAPTLLDAFTQSQMDMLVAGTTKDYDPAVYVSEFETKMAELVASKSPEETVVLSTSKSGTKEAAPVADFTASLAASLAAVGEDGKPKARKAKTKKEAA